MRAHHISRTRSLADALSSNSLFFCLCCLSVLLLWVCIPSIQRTCSCCFARDLALPPLLSGRRGSLADRELMVIWLGGAAAALWWKKGCLCCPVLTCNGTGSDREDCLSSSNMLCRPQYALKTNIPTSLFALCNISDPIHSGKILLPSVVTPDRICAPLPAP